MLGLTRQELAKVLRRELDLLEEKWSQPIDPEKISKRAVSEEHVHDLMEFLLRFVTTAILANNLRIEHQLRKAGIDLDRLDG